MESIQGQKTKLRRDISTRLDALEDLFTEELSRKLSERRLKLYYKDFIIWA